jgi:hypothetical protein
VAPAIGSWYPEKSKWRLWKLPEASPCRATSIYHRNPPSLELPDFWQTLWWSQEAALPKPVEPRMLEACRKAGIKSQSPSDRGTPSNGELSYVTTTEDFLSQSPSTLDSAGLPLECHNLRNVPSSDITKALLSEHQLKLTRILAS